MKKKFRFYFPIISVEKIATIVAFICAVLCIVIAIVHCCDGDIDKASILLICGMFNYLCYKL